MPDEQATLANAERYVALSITVEVADRGWAYGPAAGKLRPAGGRECVQPGLNARGVEGMQVRVGAAVEQLL